MKVIGMNRIYYLNLSLKKKLNSFIKNWKKKSKMSGGGGGDWEEVMEYDNKFFCILPYNRNIIFLDNNFLKF